MKKDKYTEIIDNINARNVVLASQSPRRAQLLKLMGLQFRVCPSNYDEDSIAISEPERHVQVLSLAKAREIANSLEYGLVIGADTIVVLDGEILGKPRDAEHARDMLSRLSGRTHQVYTGFAIVQQPEGKSVTGFEMTNVHFRMLRSWEIQGYINTASPFDKAGAYGIQDQSAIFADRIDGCFYNVVGFPVSKFYLALLNLMNLNYEE
ncbi:MAG TPA: nucleoside triphosphate pyrophosphatase [bacterium]|nr:nucleoside triphosphate pyrophosphatase [bacterium]HPN45087.1 nucleoside triphosphate pyrophosphatase [bacterium]